MFSILHGNRIEVLAERLLADPARRDTDVLRPETLIVPSLGMARWLKDRIALRDGVCANVECPYLGEFIWKSFSALLPDVPARSPFDPEVIAWCVFERLGALPEVPEYGPLAAYLCHPRRSTGPHARAASRGSSTSTSYTGPIGCVPGKQAGCSGSAAATRSAGRRAYGGSWQGYPRVPSESTPRTAISRRSPDFCTRKETSAPGSHEARRKRSEDYYANFRVNRDLLELRNLVVCRANRALGAAAARKPQSALQPRLSRHAAGELPDRAGAGGAQPQQGGAVARTVARHAALRDCFSAGPALRCGSGPTRTRRSPSHGGSPPSLYAVSRSC